MAVKNKFYEVNVEVLNQKISLLGASIEELNKRTVKLDLTRNLRGKSIELTLIIKADKEKAIATVKELRALGFFIRRMIRKGTDYVEDSFKVNCEDAQIQIKPFLITRKKVSRAVKNALRKESKEYLESYVKSKKFDELVKEIIENKLQKPMSLKLKKIYPLALCEIRVLKKIEELAQKEEKKTKKEDKPKEE